MEHFSRCKNGTGSGIGRGRPRDRDDNLGWRLDPLAREREAGIGADGSNDGVCCCLCAVGVLDDFVEGGVEILAAPLDKSGGMGVAIDGSLAAQLLGLVDPPGIVPVEEFLFDDFAIGVIADRALALMALECFAGLWFEVFSLHCFFLRSRI